MFLDTTQSSPFSLRWEERKPRVVHASTRIAWEVRERTGTKEPVAVKPELCPLWGGGGGHAGLRSGS